MQRKKIWALVLGGFVTLFLIGQLARKYQSVFLRLGPDSSGMTDLHWAAWDGRTSVVKKLLAKGADVNCRDKSGETPLHFAAVKGHKKTVEVLIANSADVNAKEYRNICTPLHGAAGFARVEVVKLLLVAGADVSARNRKGWTPLDIVKNALEDAPKPIIFFLRKKYETCAELLREHAEKQKK